MIQRRVTGIVGTAALGAAETAIVVPARNEEDRIGACLEALAAQRGAAVPVVSLCVNNTSDATSRVAEATARRLGLGLLLTEVGPATGGVGRARRIGHAVALRLCPKLRVLLSTDADCVAAPDWACGMVRALDTAPVVLGGIVALAHEAAALPASYFAWSEIEDRYASLAIELACLLDPLGPDGIGLNTAGGANLGFRRDAYLALGGFAPLETGEDRDIVARAQAAGLRPVRAPGAVVAASMRESGRAPHGMAARVAVRRARKEAALDSALMPLDPMIARCLAPGARPGAPEPSAAPMSRDQARRDLPRLARLVATLRGVPDPARRRRYVQRQVQRSEPQSLVPES